MDNVTQAVDWDAPLEAYRKGCDPVPVKPGKAWPDADGDYCIADGNDVIGHWFHGDGSSEGGFSEWRIRNRLASTTAQSEAVQKLVEALEGAERTLRRLEQSFNWRAGEDQADNFDSDGWKAKADECREAAAECSQSLAAHRESQP